MASPEPLTPATWSPGMPAPEGWETDPNDPNVIRKVEDTRELPEGIIPPWENPNALWTYKGLSSEAEAKQRWIEYQRTLAQAAALQQRYNELLAMQQNLIDYGAYVDPELYAKSEAVRNQLNSITQLISDLKDISTSYEVGNLGQAGDREVIYTNPEWKEWTPNKPVPPGWAVDPNDPKSLIEVDLSVTRAPIDFKISLSDQKYQSILDKTALWIPEFTKADGSLDLEGALSAGHEKDIIKLYGQNYVDVIKAQNAEKQKIADMKAKGILDADGKWADDWYDKAMAAGYSPEDLYRYGITPNDIFNAQFFSTVKEKYTLPEGGLDYAKMFNDGITLTQLRLLGVTVDGEPITQSQYEQIATAKPKEAAPEATETQTIDDSARQAFLSTHTLIPDPTGEAADYFKDENGVSQPIYMSNDTLEKLKTEQPELYSTLMNEGYIAYKNQLDAMRLDYEHQQVLLDKLAPYEVTTTQHRIGGELTDIDQQGVTTTTTSYDLEKALRDIKNGTAEITLYDLQQVFKPEAVAQTQDYIDAQDKIAPYKDNIVDYLRKNEYDTKTLIAAGYRQTDVDKAVEIAKKTPEMYDWVKEQMDIQGVKSLDSLTSQEKSKLYGKYLVNYVKTGSWGDVPESDRYLIDMYEARQSANAKLTTEYQQKYGTSSVLQSISAKPAVFVFAPARALRPDVGIKEITGGEWAMGVAQVATMALPFAKAGTFLSGALNTVGIVGFPLSTALSWKNMTPEQQKFAVGMDVAFTLLAVGVPMVAGIKNQLRMKGISGNVTELSNLASQYYDEMGKAVAKGDYSAIKTVADNMKTAAKFAQAPRTGELAGEFNIRREIGKQLEGYSDFFSKNAKTIAVNAKDVRSGVLNPKLVGVYDKLDDLVHDARTRNLAVNYDDYLATVKEPPSFGKNYITELEKSQEKAMARVREATRLENPDFIANPNAKIEYEVFKGEPKLMNLEQVTKAKYDAIAYEIRQNGYEKAFEKFGKEMVKAYEPNAEKLLRDEIEYRAKTAASNIASRGEAGIEEANAVDRITRTGGIVENSPNYLMVKGLSEYGFTVENAYDELARVVDYISEKGYQNIKQMDSGFIEITVPSELKDLKLNYAVGDDGLGRMYLSPKTFSKVNDVRKGLIKGYGEQGGEGIFGAYTKKAEPFAYEAKDPVKNVSKEIHGQVYGEDWLTEIDPTHRVQLSPQEAYQYENKFIEIAPTRWNNSKSVISLKGTNAVEVAENLVSEIRQTVAEDGFLAALARFGEGLVLAIYPQAIDAALNEKEFGRGYRGGGGYEPIPLAPEPTGGASISVENKINEILSSPIVAANPYNIGVTNILPETLVAEITQVKPSVIQTVPDIDIRVIPEFTPIAMPEVLTSTKPQIRPAPEVTTKTEIRTIPDIKIDVIPAIEPIEVPEISDIGVMKPVITSALARQPEVIGEPQPQPQPQPMPQPQPQPVPQPIPEPMPEPMPEPIPDKIPETIPFVGRPRQRKGLFVSKRQQKREERERKKREFAGAFAYRAGVVVHAFKEPYQSQSDVATFHINHLPPDIKILPDQKTAIETIQQIRPGAPIDLVIDQGFQDVHVKTTQAGNLTIGFKYDKGNQIEQGITVKKHEKRDRIKLEPLELSTGKAEDMGTNEDINEAKQNLSDVLDKLGIPDEKTEAEVPVPESAWGEEQSNIPKPVVREAVMPQMVRPKPVESNRQPSGFEVKF